MMGFVAILSLLLSLFVTGQVRANSPVVPASGSCPTSYAELQKSIDEKIGKDALYRAVLSTDKDFLKNEVLVAEGPAPQKNMRIIPGSEQFRPNPEAKQIFIEKKRLLARYPEKIIGILKGEESHVKQAVIEQFQMVMNEMPAKSPGVYKRDGNHLVNLLTGDRASVAELEKMSARKALEKLGQFVPDDIVLMKKFGDEYRVVAGHLAFPTHWNIEYALGETISYLHSDLPGTPQQVAAFSKMINGVLDRTLASTDVVRRNNWFIENDPRYALPGYQRSEYPENPILTPENYRTSAFFRTERQTLRGLPQSKMVTFSLCPYVYPVDVFAKDKGLAQTLVDGIKVKLLPEAVPDGDEYRIVRYLEEEIRKSGAAFETRVARRDVAAAKTQVLSVEKPAGLSVDPGEAFRVTLDTPSGPETRILSLANSPGAAELQFATKDSDSKFKEAFRNLAPGAKVRVEPLRTSLEFKPEKPAVMIAGGIGITPFRSFIQHAKDKDLKTPMWLFYGNRAEIPFRTELDAAASANPQLQVKNVLSRPADNWQGDRGRIDHEFLKKQVPNLPKDARYYVVGGTQMTEDVQKSLRALGVPDEQISVEAFPTVNVASEKGNPPINAATATDCQTVCFCQRVSAGAIRSAINAGEGTFDGIKAATRAATGCGGCVSNVMGFLQCAKAPGK